MLEVGDIAYYWPPPGTVLHRAAPMPALICWTDGTHANAAVFSPLGEQLSDAPARIPIVGPDEEPEIKGSGWIRSIVASDGAQETEEVKPDTPVKKKPGRPKKNAGRTTGT